MKTFKSGDGFSARRRTIRDATNSYITSTQVLLLVGLLFSLCACNDTTKGQTDTAKAKERQHVIDSLKPKVNISVNRRYDDKGNVIGFDSTYSSYYSNISGDTSSMDSLMHNFDSFFNRSHSSFFKNEFSPLFFNDSSRYPDFFHDDFFMKRYELNDKYMRSMMERMDSIKNQFYKELNAKQKRAKTL